MLNYTELEVDSAGERTTIGVKSNRDWTATVDAEWLTLTPSSAEAFEASSYMILDVEPNIDYTRTAVITVKSNSGDATASLTVTQNENMLVIKDADGFVQYLELAAKGEASNDYKVGRDLDLAGKELPVIESFPYALDFMSHTISNWTTDRPLVETITADGSIMNVTIDASCKLTIPAGHGHIGFIATTNNGTISNVINEADITVKGLSGVNNAYAGVICGQNNALVTGCENYGNMTFAGAPQDAQQNAYYAGIIGRAAGASAKVENCYNLGNLTFEVAGDMTKSYYICGITGALNSNAKALNCINDGNMKMTAYNFTNMAVVAGIGGYAGGEISNCKNKGNITLLVESAEGMADGSVQRTAVAGIAGYLGWNKGTVTGNTNEGDIFFRAGYPLKYAASGSAAKFSTNVAGLVGHMYNCATENCSNSGTVTSIIGDIDNAGSYFGTDIRQSCGGIVASSWGAITNCENSGEINVKWVTSMDDASRVANGKQFIAQVGGISGGDYHSGQANTDIIGCVNTGNINYDCDANASNNSLGGIVGWPHKEGGAGKSLKNCENAGTITVTGLSKTRVGGISGGCIAIADCINRGKIYLKSGQTSCTIGGIAGVAAGVHPVTGCESYGEIVSDVKLAGAQGGSASGIAGIIGATYNQANLKVNGCTAACDITAPEGSTAFMLIGVVGSNKAVTTVNELGTADAPNVVSGGSVTLGSTKTAMTSETYLTKAFPWGTGAPANANIAYNVIWK